MTASRAVESYGRVGRICRTPRGRVPRKEIYVNTLKRYTNDRPHDRISRNGRIGRVHRKATFTGITPDR